MNTYFLYIVQLITYECSIPSSQPTGVYTHHSCYDNTCCHGNHNSHHLQCGWDNTIVTQHGNTICSQNIHSVYCTFIIYMWMKWVIPSRGHMTACYFRQVTVTFSVCFCSQRLRALFSLNCDSGHWCLYYCT